MLRRQRPGRFGPHLTWRFLLIVLGLVALAAVWVAMPGSEEPRRAAGSRSAAAGAALTFPRSATVYLSQDSLPPVEELARYDLVVIDNEWVNRVPHSYFQDLRSRNPRLRLLAYVNLVDSAPRLGTPAYWANNYNLWQFRSPTDSRFPREWFATTAAGKPVREWQDYVMTNLTDVSPKVEGRRYVEYAANWVVDRVWSAGVWDGIYLDVWGEHIYTADSDRWDVDRNGTDELDEQIYGPGKPLDRGLTIGERIMRKRMPDAILMANGVRSMHEELLDGRVWESFADFEGYREPIADIQDYVSTSSDADHRRPGMFLTISKRRVDAGSPEEYRRARFALAATTMQNGFWAPMGAHYGEPVYFDELDGGGLGRGYLGQPMEPNPDLTLLTRSNDRGTGSPARDVYRRDFEHGIVLLNTGTAPSEVVLEKPYRHIDGRQDRKVNNGESVSRVTIPARDAVILLDPDTSK